MSDLVGKTVLVGITCVGGDGTEVDRFQAFGTIETVGERWISLRREGLAEPFGLPPVPELLVPAGEGAYTLRSTGEQIVHLDYTAELRVTVTDAESLLTIRGVGFSPE
jgi:hypothetical protein